MTEREREGEREGEREREMERKRRKREKVKREKKEEKERKKREKGKRERKERKERETDRNKHLRKSFAVYAPSWFLVPRVPQGRHRGVVQLHRSTRRTRRCWTNRARRRP